MKISAPTSLASVSTLEDLKKFTSIFAQQISAVLNGKVTFADNLLSSTLEFSFLSTGQNFGLDHGLGVVPKGYLLAGSDTPQMSIYDGSIPNTDKTLYLRSSVVGKAKVLVYG